ncbi:MAG TPA: invasion associated locus B family protein [Methylocystis sp.]|jgi:invasion protein IalB
MSALRAQQPKTSKYGVWESQCAATSNGKACALVQKMMSEEQPSIGIMVSVRKSPGTPNGVIEFFAPPGTFLLEGVGIKVDNYELGKLPFFRCNQIACAAEGQIGNDVLDKMLNGKTMLVTIYLNPGEGVRHIFKLDGFEDGYKALRE